MSTLRDLFSIEAESFACCLGHSLGEYSALVCSKSLRYFVLGLYFLLLIATLPNTSHPQIYKSITSAIGLLAVRAASAADIESREEIMVSAMIFREEYEDIRSVIGDLLKEADEINGPFISSVNSPTQAVISGTKHSVENFMRISKSILRSNVGFVRLNINVPFHTILSSKIRTRMEPALNTTKFSKPVIPVISNVTAEQYESEKNIPELLSRQITEPVMWSDSLRSAKKFGSSLWISIGPGNILTTITRQIYPNDTVM